MGGYTVSVQDTIKDVGLWRRVINGYPYKSIEELGVANKEEAFTATKQAIYCYIHGNNPDDYEAIGEAGERTLRAMHAIINNAQNSTETKISSTIQINKEDNEWKQDEIDKEYVSKLYYITAGANVEKCKVNIVKENAQDIGGIKLTDLKNNEKNEFAANEKFKVLIPIKNMTEQGRFRIFVEGMVNTKPVLYGSAPDSNYQDYALTTVMYEDGAGEKSDEYPKNETKIIIIKEDEETKERLKDTEFEILDENKEVVYNNLKTDHKGEIELDNLIPGKYYLRETNAKEGYEKYEQLIEIDISLHEQYTVKVKNGKEQKPEIQIKKLEKSKEVTTKTVEREKLPLTGI